TAGTYSIIVTDTLGCIDNSLVTVVSPPQIALDTTIIGVTCFGGNDGSIDLIVSGGVTPYTYLWSNGATTEDINSLTTGFYGVTITDDNGCVDSLSVLFVGTAPQIIFDTTVTGVTCYNGSDGAIDLLPSGGTPAYLYNWSNGASSQDLSGITSGFYSVTLTDASGCQDSLIDVFVDQPPVYVVDSFQITDVSCNGGNDGQIIVFVSGGTVPYIYSWSNGQLNDTVINLVAGNYNLAVFDANLCPLFDTFTVNESAVIALTSNVTDVSCNLQSDGSIDLIPTGGTLPYSFIWSDSSTSEDISGLTAGSYTVTITDNNGCSDSLTIVVNQPVSLSVSATITNETCTNSGDGSIDLTTTGGTSPYTYLWSEGSTSEDLNAINNGSYIVSVSDNNGCSESRVFNVGVQNNLSTSYAVVNTTCGNSLGSIDLWVNNGSGSYAYNWSNGATTEDIDSLSHGSYFVTVSDLITGCTITDSTSVVGTSGLGIAGFITNTSCGGSDGIIVIGIAGGTGPYSISWSNGASGSVNSGLSPGLYTATATDATGCMVSESFNVAVDNTLNVSDTVSLANCNLADGSIDITITGGSGSYSYNWSNGAITEDVSSLVAGTYSVTVDDLSSGCRASSIISVGNTGGPTLSFNVTDLSCNGINTGSIDLSVAGGSGSYIYNWSNGFTSEDIGALYAGVYFVQVQDMNTGCISIDSVMVNEPELIMLEFDVTHVTCFGAGDASIDLTVTGGTMPYNFFWSGGFTTEDLNGIGGGTYTVLVQDLNSCVASSDVVINEPTPIALDTNVTHISCFGNVNGSIDLIVNGGTNPYTYLWSNGSTTEDISSLAAGSYDVTVTDFNGCQDSMQAIVINEPTAIALDTNVTSVSCFGTVTGSIILLVSGGTPAYSYIWSDGDTLKDQNPTAAGTYHVTVTDANGCVDSLTNIVVDQPQPLVIDSIRSTDVVCNGGNDGSAVAFASGGSSPYIYSWSSGHLNDTANNLTAGTYYVTVLDVNGCNTNDSVYINEPVTILTYTISNVTCFGINNGSIITNYTGGAMPYDYQWNTGDTTQNLNNLGPGNYSLTVTDAMGCQDTANMTITQPSALLITNTSTNSSCPGIDNAMIDITVTGGVLPYSYIWSNGDNTEDLDSLGVGMYTIQVADSNSCTLQRMISIGSDSTLYLSHAITLATCGENDGSIDIDVIGGSGNYSYLWNTGQTTEDIDSIAYGSYFVTVTDVISGCEIYDNFNVNNNGSPTINSTIVDESTCGASDGSISLAISGGSGFYTYSWSTGANSPNINGLTAGSYSVTVSDFLAQCSSSEVFEISVQSNMTLTFTTTSSGCGQSNGNIDLTVSGGSGSYAYQWSNGSNTEDIGGIANGVYFVTVTDLLNSCSSQVTRSTVISVSDSSNLILNTISSNPSCPSANDGSLDLSVGGGSGIYSYNWSNGSISQDIAFLTEGPYSVIVRDIISNCVSVLLDTLNDPEPISLNVSVTNNNCFGEFGGALDLSVSGGSTPYTFNWSHGPSTEDVSNLASGNYTVDILDLNNCVLSTEMGIADPPAMVFDTVVTHNLCYGDSIGSIDLTVSGGIAPYFYFWSNGTPSQDINSLTAGLYTVSVMDNNTCMDSLTVRISEPVQLVLDTTKTDVSCFGGSDGAIDLIVIGGVSPYSYNWSNGFTSQDIGVLTSGYYTVTVNDANGCTETIDSVFIDQPADLLIDTILITHVPCFGYNNGQATAQISGGTTPYNLFWNGVPGDTAFNLTAGAYNLLVTDNLGCNVIENFNVNQPAQITSSMSVAHVSCYGGSDGDASVLAGGGVPPFTYLWSSGETNDSIVNVSAGTYTVSITDANGCVRIDSIIVNQPDSIIINLIPTHVLCNGDSTGSILAFVTGGITPYTYLWNNGQSSSNIINLPAGSYSISITDSRSCPLLGPATNSINITEPAALSLTMDSIDVSCPGGNDGRATATVSGGVAPYTYLWGDGQTTDTAFNLSAGIHIVDITDSNSCNVSGSILLNQPATITVNKTVNNISCNGAIDGSILISPSGGTPGYTYVWSTGQTVDSIVGLSAGIYYVTVMDTAGCQLVDTSQIIEPALITISVDSFELRCYNDSSGMAIANVTGGTSPFIFNWSTGYTGDTLAGLSIGNYSVTVVDQGGCTDSATFSISQPTQVSGSTITLSNYNGYDVSYQGASDGSSAVIPAGGIPPYTYLWDSSANYQTTAIATGLSAGVYYVSVYDNRGCAGVTTDTLNEPPPIILTTSVTTNYNGEDVSCFRFNDGGVVVTASGGVPPYTFQWDSAAGGGTDSFAINLYGGSYDVTVTDLNGGTMLGTVTVVDPTRVVASAIVNSNYSGYSVSCSGSSDGLATVSASGGVFPYNYLWSTGDTTNFTSGLTAGKYFVTASDLNNCLHVDSVVLIEPQPLTMSIDSSKVVTCNAGNDGSASVTPVGGAGPFSYNWSDGQTDSTAVNLSAGSYSVTITDGNGCSAIGSLNVNEPLTLTIAIDSVNVACSGSSTGRATAIASGGTPGYQYLWSNGDPDSINSSIPAGLYEITVTDNNGCTAFEDVNITEPSPFIVNHVKSDASCFGFSDGDATVQPSGGVPPYSYIWPTLNTTQSETNLVAGTYNVTVIDANNCTVIESIVINEPPQIQIGLDTTSISCFSANDGVINATLSGGSGSFLFNWSNGSSSLNQQNLGPGSYSITVTDGNGCTDSSRIALIEPEPLQIDLLASNPTCYGSFNGLAVASGFGGSWPYSYNWSSGSNSATAQNLESGLHIVTVTDNNGCSTMSSIVLDNPPPIQIITPVNPIELTLGGTAILDIEHNVNQDSVLITWSPEYGLSCTDCEDPAASPYHSTEYTVTVTNITDPNVTCTGSTIIEIIVVENLDLFVPNAFTPNGDGDNDVFNMYSESLAGVRIQIFNRIGEMVFESSASNAGWDGYYKGELAPPGVYVYNAEILFISGKTVTRNGTVTLIR
ncbi:MAG: T9SS type B sorting domain-containing protein, partial [Chitinophagales bacterium]|nr:T9SS type B sorting domain-containing protein [Chitinophagales bacterium]